MFKGERFYKIFILAFFAMLFIGSGIAEAVGVNVWMLIDHPSITDLSISLGVGNPASPNFVTTVHANQANTHVRFLENINKIVDVTIPDNLWPPPPGSSNTYWLRVTDTAAGNFGILRSWCLSDEPLSPLWPRSPAVNGLPCEYSPMDLTVPLDITDFQTTFSFIGESFGTPNNPGQQACAGIYGQFTTMALLGGDEFSFYITRTGNALSGFAIYNVTGTLVVGLVSGTVNAAGNCFLSVIILNPSTALAGTLEEIVIGGSTFGRFNFSGNSVNGIIPPTVFDLPKVSG